MIKNSEKTQGFGQCGGELELYLHIPFCVKKCKYCDFLSFPVEEDTISRYVEALCLEIAQKQKLAKGYKVRSIFFGGGTPSLLNGGHMQTLMDTIATHYKVSPQAEITMEANPGTLTVEKCKAYREAGINRLSMGLQSANAEHLQRLGRIHTFQQFLEGYRMAVDCGFANINVDVMSGLPGQTKEDLENTLHQLLSLDPPPTHFSVYSLILEEGTKLLEEYEAGLFSIPSEEEDREMYALTGALLAKYGYHRYEISNYAKEGRECIHNKGYWERVPYLGFGLGAASLYENKRYQNQTDLKSYLEKPQDASFLSEELSKEDQMSETIFLGLRMMEGVSEKGFLETYGCELMDVFGTEVKKNQEDGLLVREDGRIYLTEKGIDVSNYVMAQFLLS